jgi:hypothetical protein
MKRIAFLSIYLLFIVAGLSSCRSEEMKLVNKLDGTWNLTHISLLVAAADSVELPTSGFIIFESCRIGKNNIDQCEGNFKFNEGPLQPFLYQPGRTSEGELTAINLYEKSPQTSYKFSLSLSYNIINLTKSNLELEGRIYVLDDTGTYNSHNVSMHFKR